MRKCLAIVALVLLSVQLIAQTPTLLLLSSDTLWRSKSIMAFAAADAGIASNAVDWSFMETSLFGGHLQRESINELIDKMPDRARAGYAGSGQLELLNFRDSLFGKPNLGLRAALSTQYTGYASFHPNAFETIYRGNTADLNAPIELGPLSFENQAWQKFGFGVFNKRNLSGITLSLVEGQSYQAADISRAQLFTAAQGDYVSLSLEGDYARSDTTRKGWANGSGIGACIDFDYNTPIQNGRGVVSLAVRNLGFIAWNEQSEQYVIDSKFDWNGLDVTNWLSGVTDTVALPNWNDSLNARRVQSEVWKPLPASIHLRYVRHWKGKRYLETGCSFSPNKAAVPAVYVGLTHAISERLFISERLTYGGYTGFAIGADVQWLLRSSWFLRAGSAQLEGWLLPSAGGRSVYFNLGKNF
jgi:hypothetical protein